MKKLVSIIIAVVLTLSVSSFAFAAGEESAGTAVKTGTAEKAAIPQEIKDKRADLKALFEKAKAIRSDIEATRGKVKARLAEIKAEFKNMTPEEKKAAKADLQALRAKLKDYRSQIEAIRADLKAKTEAMATNRTQLKEAVKSASYDTAGSILDTMLKIKAEKNTDLEKLLDTRIKMLDEMK